MEDTRQAMTKTAQRNSSLAAWTGLILAVVGLGLIAWIVSSINELHARLATLSPRFASAVVVVILVVLLGVLALGVRFWLSARRPTGPSVDHLVHDDPVGAARQTLDAAQQHLTLISDEVARRALSDELHEVSTDLEQRRFSIVVFGTTSAGKTSIISGLLGRSAGATDPITGTTRDRVEHEYSLGGTGQSSLRLIDTPGLSEIGAAGAMREERARELAVEADMLLFVVDQDLRDIEFKPLAELARLGKRSLVVFNKKDLYRPEDIQIIMSRLRERLHNTVDSESIVICAAAPAAVTVRDAGGSHQESPPPDVGPLADRISELLRKEGLNMLAQNVLLRAKRISDKARDVVHAARVEDARRIVNRFTWTTAGVLFVNPIPGVNVLAGAAINYQMITEIARSFGVEIRAEQAKKMAKELAQVMIKLGVVGLATEIIGKALKASIVGYVAGGAIEALAGGYLTRMAGDVFIDYFAHDQNWGDGGMQGAIERKFRMQKQGEFITEFVKEAARRILEPQAVPRPPGSAAKQNRAR